MFKMIANLLLSLVLGSLKSLLLKHIESLTAENMTNEEKRKAVFIAFKADAVKEGKTLRDSLINLAIELGVSLIKDKIK